MALVALPPPPPHPLLPQICSPMITMLKHNLFSIAVQLVNYILYSKQNCKHILLRFPPGFELGDVGEGIYAPYTPSPQPFDDVTSRQVTNGHYLGSKLYCNES